MNRPPEDEDQAPLFLQMPEGVHLDMPDEAYFGARAIGSSDLKRLYWQPESWWYASFLNPRRRMRVKNFRKQALDLGTALHDLVLLGEDAYRERFVFEPDADHPHWLTTPLEVKAELRKMGKRVDDVYGWKLNEMAKRAGLGPRVWDIAWTTFDQAKKAGSPYMTEDEDMRVRHTARLILEHKELGHAMRGPTGLSEVAVFWRRPEDPDTLLRAKFDRLDLQRMFDLKSLGNWRGRDIDAAIADAIEQNDYGIQRAFYDEAFRYLVEFILAGNLHAWAPDGGSRPVGKTDRDKLRAIADAGPAVWVWIFVQLRNDTVGQERAPMIEPRWHRPEGRIWAEGKAKVEDALASYRRLRDAFGVDQPWARIGNTLELKDSDIRSRTKRELT